MDYFTRAIVEMAVHAQAVGTMHGGFSPPKRPGYETTPRMTHEVTHPTGTQGRDCCNVAKLELCRTRAKYLL